MHWLSHVHLPPQILGSQPELWSYQTLAPSAADKNGPSVQQAMVTAVTGMWVPALDTYC